MTLSVGNDEESRKIEKIHEINKLRATQLLFSESDPEDVERLIASEKQFIKTVERLVELIKRAEKLIERCEEIK